MLQAAFRQYVDAHLDEAVEMLKRLCTQPSVSTQNYGVLECAELVRELLEMSGITASILPTEDPRYPVVYGELTGTSNKTILFYNHYDVQPPEPMELWDTPPFQPVEKSGRIYARGASDDKGQLAARLAAIKALLHIRGSLPFTVKFCIEGAEEIGSPGFFKFVQTHQDLLRADACVWEGSGVNWQGQPLITLGVKGIAYVELECRGAATDSHSSYAPVVPNPAWRLVWALNTLKDQDDKVLINGFYDHVRNPTQAEIEAIKNMPPDEDHYKQALGLNGFIRGLTGFDFRRHLYLDPTCTICGLESGYIGEGAKTILPSWARAKVDFRLVPHQEPVDIVDKLKTHLENHGFMDINVLYLGGVHPSRTPIDADWVKLVSKAGQSVYRNEPVVVPTSPGSGPMYAIQQLLKLPVADFGVSYPDNRIHAPNENVRIDYFRLGILHAIEVMEQFGVS